MARFLELHHFTTLSWIYVATAAVTAGIFVLVWRRRTAQFARYFLGLEAAVFLWCLSASFEVATTNLDLKVFWSQMAYPGITTSPVFFFLFALDYGQVDRKPGRLVTGLLFVIPAFICLVAVFQPHLLWTRLENIPGTSLAEFFHGPVFWLLVAYEYTLLVTGFILIGRSIFRYSGHFRTRTILVILSSLLPFSGNVMYVTNINPLPGMEWTPLCFALSGVLLVWATLGMGLFNLVPIARNRLLEAMAEGMLVVDAAGRVVDSNPALVRFLDQTQDQVMGRDGAELLAPWPGLRDCLDKTACSIATQLSTDPPLYAEISISTISNRVGDNLGRLLLFHDVTERTMAEKALQHMASTDDLTGLSNRRRFMQLARQEESRAKRYGRPLAVCMIDLDHFKQVNDEHGHDSGDKTLKVMGRVLKECCRETDLPARLGGEEFAVLLPETGQDAAALAANRLLQAIAARPVQLDSGEIRITASIGVACQSPCSDFAALLKDADRALYKAKNLGRNRVHCAAPSSPAPPHSA